MRVKGWKKRWYGATHLPEADRPRPRSGTRVEIRVGVHEWGWSPELHCLVCAWCGEAEAMALADGCPAVLIQDRDNQVFTTRVLEPVQVPSLVDGVGYMDVEI